MVVRLNYACSPYFSIKSISVIGSFNSYDPNKNKMKLRNGCWITEIDLPPGEHRYKLLINGEIKLNDPAANVYLPDEKEELWSIILINDQNQRLYNNEQYAVNLKDYCLANRITDQEIIQNKRSFSNTTDKKIVARFAFDHVTGLHAVTAVWYDRYGRFYEYAENSLYVDNDSKDEATFLWFWMDLDDPTREFEEGIYRLMLFINGKYILQDEITVLRDISYLADRFPYADHY